MGTCKCEKCMRYVDTDDNEIKVVSGFRTSEKSSIVEKETTECPYCGGKLVPINNSIL